MEIKVDIGDMLSELDKVNDKTIKALGLYGNTVALKAEGKAKSGAKWIDRTGSARQRLKGEVSESGNSSVRVTLSHNVDYGIYLEYCHGGKNAIVEPTIDSMVGDVVEGLKNLIK